jgi:hypothetical protein
MPRIHQYKVVSKLPKNAIRVKDYAKQRGVSHSLIYHELARKVAAFEIVQFQEINFVIPHPEKK